MDIREVKIIQVDPKVYLARQRSAEWYKNNKEKVKTRNAERVICSLCNKEYSRANIKRHLKDHQPLEKHEPKKHLIAINIQSLVINLHL